MKGRSWEKVLLGDVGRVKLYRSVMRPCIIRARSCSSMFKSRISCMRARRYAMPSSAGSDSDAVVAFRLTRAGLLIGIGAVAGAFKIEVEASEATRGGLLPIVRGNLKGMLGSIGVAIDAVDGALGVP